MCKGNVHISEHHNEAVWVQWIQFAKKQRSVSRSSSSRGSVLCLMLPTWLPPPPPAPSSPPLWACFESHYGCEVKLTPAWTHSQQWAATLLTSGWRACNKQQLYHLDAKQEIDIICHMSLLIWKLVITCLHCLYIYFGQWSCRKKYNQSCINQNCQCVLCMFYLSGQCMCLRYHILASKRLPGPLWQQCQCWHPMSRPACPRHTAWYIMLKMTQNCLPALPTRRMLDFIFENVAHCYIYILDSSSFIVEHYCAVI